MSLTMGGHCCSPRRHLKAVSVAGNLTGSGLGWNAHTDLPVLLLCEHCAWIWAAQFGSGLASTSADHAQAYSQNMGRNYRSNYRNNTGNTTKSQGWCGFRSGRSKSYSTGWSYCQKFLLHCINFCEQSLKGSLFLSLVVLCCVAIKGCICVCSF